MQTDHRNQCFKCVLTLTILVSGVMIVGIFAWEHIRMEEVAHPLLFSLLPSANWKPLSEPTVLLFLVLS